MFQATKWFRTTPPTATLLILAVALGLAPAPSARAEQATVVGLGLPPNVPLRPDTSYPLMGGMSYLTPSGAAWQQFATTATRVQLIDDRGEIVRMVDGSPFWLAYIRIKNYATGDKDFVIPRLAGARVGVNWRLIWPANTQTFVYRMDNVQFAGTATGNRMVP